MSFHQLQVSSLCFRPGEKRDQDMVAAVTNGPAAGIATTSETGLIPWVMRFPMGVPPNHQKLVIFNGKTNGLGYTIF
jgi:hypothetical protein